MKVILLIWGRLLDAFLLYFEYLRVRRAFLLESGRRLLIQNDYHVFLLSALVNFAASTVKTTNLSVFIYTDVFRASYTPLSGRLADTSLLLLDLLLFLAVVNIGLHLYYFIDVHILFYNAFSVHAMVIHSGEAARSISFSFKNLLSWMTHGKFDKRPSGGVAWWGETLEWLKRLLMLIFIELRSYSGLIRSQRRLLSWCKKLHCRLLSGY